MQKLKIFGYLCLSLVLVVGLITIVASGGGGGSDSSDDNPDDTTIDPYEITPSTITTFDDEGTDICLEDGKPVIRMFSGLNCPYCGWDAKAFNPVVKMYVDRGLIVAHHWEVLSIAGTGDDLLTIEEEGTIPDSELDIFGTFNPDYSTPTFVFGCKYTRVGATRYNSGNLEAEAAEFMAIIEELLDATAP